MSADREEVAFCVLFPCPQGILRRLVVYPNTSLTVCWVTVGGHASEFIMKSIASGMLGRADASTFQADVGAKKTGIFFQKSHANFE